MRYSIHTLAPVLVALASTLAAHAQDRPFPMTTTARSDTDIALRASPSSITDLARHKIVRLTGVPVPGRANVSLDLRRVQLGLAANAIHVNGKVSTDRDPSFSLWSGSVVSQPGSTAFLAFSHHGTYGWFGMPGKLVHLMAEPGPRHDWSVARIATDTWVARAGHRLDFSCNMQTLPGNEPVLAGNDVVTPANGPLPIYDAPIAFETDFEFFQLFGNLDAARTYALALIGAVSDQYRQQVGVIFTLPYVGFHTTNTDPWTATDCFARLSQFRTAWRNGGAPKRAELYHMISGVRVSGCGGVAYLNVICNQSSGFGMSAHINRRLTFPPRKGPLTWDFFVLGHELGHQFGTRHTHDYTPKIDNCAQRQCRSNGTIMSYCHICSGGMNNIDLRFHDRTAATMRNAVVRSCLKRFDGILASDAGNALAGSNGTPVQSLSYSSPNIRVNIKNAPSSRPGLLVIGGRDARIPIFGGTLVPRPDINLALVANASGATDVTLPAVGSFQAGLQMWMHSWFLDPSGRNPFAATNATRVELIRP